MTIPLARTNKLLITEVGEEVIVYDQERDVAHCLNAMAAKVWHYCDGQNTVEDIAQLLEEDLEVSADENVDWRGLVGLTLEELERFHLIQEYLSQPISPVIQSAGVSQVSRRKVIKTATLVGGFAVGSMFPVVKSIVAPKPAMASSPTLTLSPITISEWELDRIYIDPDGDPTVEISSTTTTLLGTATYRLGLSTQSVSGLVDITNRSLETSVAVDSNGDYSVDVDFWLPGNFNFDLGTTSINFKDPRFGLGVEGNIGDIEESDFDLGLSALVELKIPLKNPLTGSPITISTRPRLSTNENLNTKVILGVSVSVN